MHPTGLIEFWSLPNGPLIQQGEAEEEASRDPTHDARFG